MTRKETLWTIAAVIAAIVLGFGIWGFSVWFSPTAGKAQVYKDQNSSQNREYWSMEFAADMNSLTADQAAIATLKQAAQNGTQQDQMNLTGARLNCQQDVAKYNTDSVTLLGFRFLPEGYPKTVSVETFCN